jgi:microcystin-dependent protein
MTIETPIWVQGSAGVPSFPARNDRTIIEQLYDEGVMDLTALTVTQRAAGANFTVDVAVGVAVVAGDDQVNQGAYMVRVSAFENATVTAAPGSNSRYDIVCLRINDPNAGGNAGYTGTIVVTAGTVSATPVAPAVPASSLLLATIGPIAIGTASITNAIITDSRTEAGRRCRPGTLELCASTRTPSGWLQCNGAAVSRTTYARLFASISTSYGTGDGSTTFNLPDFRDRVPVMKGTAYPTVGATGGAATVTLGAGDIPSHSHTVNSHSHGGATGYWSSDHTHYTSGTTSGFSANHTHGVSIVTDWEADHSHLSSGVGGVNLIGAVAGGTGLAGGSGGPQIGYYTSTSNAGGHDHSVNGNTGGVSTDHTHTFAATSSGASANHTHGIAAEAPGTSTSGSGAAHNNMQPFQVAGAWLIRI